MSLYQITGEALVFLHTYVLSGGMDVSFCAFEGLFDVSKGDGLILNPFPVSYENLWPQSRHGNVELLCM